MKIAMIGNLKPPHSTENDLEKSLRILGHAVWTYQEDRYADGDTLPVMTEADEDVAPDLVLWLHTHHPAYDRRDWRRAFPGVPYVGFTLDLFRGLKRHDPEYVRTHPWFTCDHFYQPDEPDWLISQGVKGARFSPPGILETSAYAAAPDPLHPAYGKIIFVGSRTYHKEWGWRQELLAFCEKEYGDRFQVYEHSSGMRGHALNVLYASAAVAVGDSCLASPDSRYTSDRLYETLGRGGNLVYPAINFGDLDIEHNIECCESDCYGRLIELYEPGNTESLKNAIWAAEVAWDKEQEGGDINLPAHIRRGHTYTHRLRKILEEVKP